MIEAFLHSIFATGRRAAAPAFAAVIILAAALGGCTRPDASVLLPIDTVVPGAKLVTVYVATTRVREPDSTVVYTSGRAPKLNYAEFTIAIPPNHKMGAIEWPNGAPDPQTDFVTVSQRLLTSAEFERQVAARNHSKAGVFVHGYNTNFQEGVFRLAQLVSDADVVGVPVLFAWPSDGTLLGYVSDKDSATYSRDELVALLTMLGRDRKAGDVTVLGHSMGGWLTIESLRQMRLTGRTAAINKLNVILASPDIDVDVFRSQIEVIGPLTPPMTILVSRDDKALAVSSRISGRRPRLGALDVDNPVMHAAARKADIRLIDISSVQASDRFNHDRFVTYAALYSRLAPTGQRGPGQAGAFIFNTVGSVISSPFTLVGGALAGQ